VNGLGRAARVWIENASTAVGEVFYEPNLIPNIRPITLLWGLRPWLQDLQNAATEAEHRQF
jgi:hypothetical protein